MQKRLTGKYLSGKCVPFVHLTPLARSRVAVRSPVRDRLISISIIKIFDRFNRFDWSKMKRSIDHRNRSHRSRLIFTNVVYLNESFKQLNSIIKWGSQTLLRGFCPTYDIRTHLTSKTCSNILKLNSDIGLLHLIEVKINPAVLNYLSQSVEEGH